MSLFVFSFQPYFFCQPTVFFSYNNQSVVILVLTFQTSEGLFRRKKYKVNREKHTNTIE